MSKIKLPPNLGVWFALLMAGILVERYFNRFLDNSGFDKKGFGKRSKYFGL